MDEQLYRVLGVPQDTLPSRIERRFRAKGRPTLATGRRWYRFSLRTLLILTAVAAFAMLGISRYLQPYPFEVSGNLSRNDIAAICELIQCDRELSRYPIVRLWGDSQSGTAYVQTDGNWTGFDATLQRKKRGWSIVEIELWKA